jgi:hypothetical protein
MQYAYPDGGMSETGIVVDLYYAQNRSKIVSLKDFYVDKYVFVVNQLYSQPFYFAILQ